MARKRYNDAIQPKGECIMQKKTAFTTKRIVMIGLMAALVFVGSGLRIVIPVSVGGNTAFHLGNIMCALSGILLGPWFGGLASAIGSALYDLTNPAYAAECWITFLLKGAYGLVAGLIAWAGHKEGGYWKSLLASVCAAVTYAVLYLGKSYLMGGILSGKNMLVSWGVVIDKLPATIFNAAVAVIFAPILAVAIRKALKLSHLKME